MEKVLPIKNTHNYFIDFSGFVFKVIGGKEIAAPIKNSHSRGKKPIVKINGKWVQLEYLMLSHFFPDIKASQTVSYKIGKDLRIHGNSIKIKDFVSEYISDDEEQIMNNFKCAAKANSANSRCDKKITPLQVYMCLKINKFKCIYCGIELNENDWHLDHYQPLSKQGKNVFENLASSCSVCNLMKRDLHGGEFYKKISSIYKNFIYKNDKNKATTA